MAVDGMSVLTGLGSLLGLGGAGSKYTRAQARLTDLLAGQYRAYMPQLNRMLLQMIQSGGATPALAAEQRQAEADTDGYFRQALAKLLTTNQRTGLGNSWQQQQSTLALARSRASTLAQQRVQRLAEGDDRVWRAMQLLAGSAGGTAGTALSSYNRLGDDASRQVASILELMGSLGR